MGGYKFFAKDGNAIGLQRLVDSCKQANKRLIAGVAADCQGRG